MRKYHLKLRTKTRLIVLIFIFFVCFLIAAGFLFPIIGLTVRIAITIFIILVTQLTIRKYTIYDAEFSVSDDGVFIAWAQNPKDELPKLIYIKWEDIKKYNNPHHRMFNLFNITLKSGYVWRFCSGGFLISDDFQIFYKDFESSFVKFTDPAAWERYYKESKVKS